MTDDLRPLDALQLAAEYVGCVMVMTSSADRRDTNGRRYLADQCPSRLRRLIVLKPNRYAPSRTSSLMTGSVICQASLEELDVDAAAELLLTHSNLRRQAA